MPAGPASGESSLPGSQVATPSLCLHVPAGAMEPSPGHLSEAPPSNSNTGIRFQRMHSGGDANIQPAAPTLGLHVRGRAVVCLSLCRWAASPANRILSDLVFASRRLSCSRGEAIRPGNRLYNVLRDFVIFLLQTRLKHE